MLRAATANADAATRIVDGDPDTVGTAVAARSLASAIPGAVGGTPSCWRNASVRPCRAGRGLFALARFLQRGNPIGPELLRVRRKRGADAPL